MPYLIHYLMLQCYSLSSQCGVVTGDIPTSACPLSLKSHLSPLQDLVSNWLVFSLSLSLSLSHSVALFDYLENVQGLTMNSLCKRSEIKTF